MKAEQAHFTYLDCIFDKFEPVPMLGVGYERLAAVRGEPATFLPLLCGWFSVPVCVMIWGRGFFILIKGGVVYDLRGTSRSNSGGVSERT